MQPTTHRYSTLTKKAGSSQLRFLLIGCMLLIIFTSAGLSDELDLVREVEFQPLVSATQRLIEALDYLGSPLSEGDLSAIEGTLGSDNHEQQLLTFRNHWIYTV